MTAVIPAPVLRNWGALREPRVGIMLHYTEGTDPGDLQWLLTDKRCAVSYNRLYLDTGQRVQIAPELARAWHAGACRPSSPQLRYRDANSAFYGYAVSARHTETATPAQVAAIVADCVTLFRAHGWPAADTWRITGHRAEAWPRGRKDDPDGKLGKVVDVDAVRLAVAAALA